MRARIDELEEHVHLLKGDLARRKQVIAQLSASIGCSDDAIIDEGLDGTVRFFSLGAERMFGYCAAEILGQDACVLLVPEHRREGAVFARRDVMQGGAIERLKTQRVNRAGKVFDVLQTSTPVRSEAGEVVSVTSLLRDVSYAEHLEERFRLAVDASHAGMLLVDESGRIQMVNREMERLLAYTRSEMLALTVDALVPRFASSHRSFRGGFLKSPEARSMGRGRDLFAVRKDGTEVPVEIGLTPLTVEHQRMMLASVVDLSERKAGERHLREAHEQLERRVDERTRALKRSNADLEQFAYAASHDLQEPLRMVTSYMDLLAEEYGGQLSEEADTYIRFAIDGARRMQELLNALLAYSRIDSKDGALVETDTEQCANDALKDLEVAASAAQARFVFEGLPVVMANPAHFRQLLQNLFSNAIRFCSGRPPRVHVSAKRVEERWLFSVRDNGIGIEPDHFEIVFEMFKRLHAIGEYPGTGIGLALCKRIVERMGGSIWVESQVGEGSTFSFTIPVKRAVEVT
ncbi:sensor histidine kinase [Labilithrix luteola]|nr:PAS domain S-box protein [Labilithrix luteola]